MKKKKTQSSSRATPEELGKALIEIYESGYLDKTKSYKMSFLKGVLGGLGGAVGATLVLTLLVWILSLFHNVPLIGRLVENVQQTINSRGVR